MANTRQTPPCASASNRRSTRSGAGWACESRRVVRGARRRLTPATPAARITRASRVRLTATPASASSACTRGAPYVLRLPAWIACTRAVRSASACARADRGRPTPRVVPARGDAEHAGHRGDTETSLIRTHEPGDRPGPVSRANQAVAVARISRSSRRRRFSRRSRRSSSRSSVRRPSVRTPASRSACATQLRIAWADGSHSLRHLFTIKPLLSASYGYHVWVWSPIRSSISLGSKRPTNFVMSDRNTAGFFSVERASLCFRRVP